MKIYIDTLGCEKNTADSENAAWILEQAGHTIINSAETAEAVIVNTCGFINDAKEQSIERIFELSQLKNKDALLIVSGCLAQRYGTQLFKEMPEADIFIGVNDYPRLPEILEKHEKGIREKHLHSYDKIYNETGFRKRMGETYSASVKIAEGCNNVCSYCIIPSIRGGYRSRKIEDILSEVTQLVSDGCREIILIAQDVTAYGSDIYGEYRLAKLVNEVCKIEDLHWLRLMYCYEDRITDELIEAIAKNAKVCRYLDIPTQHGSDKMLKLMNRHSTNESIKNTISSLRKAVPDIHIRTTLITGHPGETSEDFEELSTFVEEMQFERLGVFTYSKEEGTLAAEMKGQVREQTKQKRREHIMSLQREISLKNNQEKIGKTLEVLVELQEEDGSYSGRTAYDAPDIDNSILFTSKHQLKPGDFVFVKVSDAFDYDLIGEEVEN